MTIPKAAARWRWYLKAGLATVLNALGTHGTPLRVAGGYRPLVLGYHRVVEDFDEAVRHEMASMLISAAMFERHVDFLARHFTFVSLDEVGEAVRRGIPFAKPVAAITFDDGYADVFDHAVPILKRKGISAAVFVVTDLVGRSAWQIHDKLYHLVEKGFSCWSNPRRELHGVLTDLGLPASDILRDRMAARSPLQTVSALLPNLAVDDVGRVMVALEQNVGNGFVGVPRTMTWPMLRQMRDDGFTVGSHTRRHVSLPKESPATRDDELRGSKQTIEEQLGSRIDHFAYPGGHFTPGVVEALADCGYRYAYTACPHDHPRHPELTIERLLLWEGSSIDADGAFSEAILGCQAHDLWPPSRVCSRAHADHAA
jgi:peptidoglycan/xylan/chitin deacetylase (PgdA/CDA1 family)